MKQTFKKLLIAMLVLCTFVGVLPMISADNSTAQAAATAIYYDFTKANNGDYTSTAATNVTKFKALSYNEVATRTGSTATPWAYYSYSSTSTDGSEASAYVYYQYTRTHGLLMATSSRANTLKAGIKFKGMTAGKYVPFLHVNGKYLRNYSGVITARVYPLNSNGSLGTIMAEKEIFLADYPEEDSRIQLGNAATFSASSEYVLEVTIDKERTFAILNGLELYAADTALPCNVDPTNNTGVYEVTVGGSVLSIPYTQTNNDGTIDTSRRSGWSIKINGATMTGDENTYLKASNDTTNHIYKITAKAATSTPQTIEFIWGAYASTKINVIVRPAGYTAPDVDVHYDFKKATPVGSNNQPFGTDSDNIGEYIKFKHTTTGSFTEMNTSITSAPWQIDHIDSTVTFSPRFPDYGIKSMKKGATDIRIKVPHGNYYIPQLEIPTVTVNGVTARKLYTPITVSILDSAGATLSTRTIPAGDCAERINLVDWEAPHLVAGEYIVRINKTETGSDASLYANYYDGIYLKKTTKTYITLNPNGGAAGGTVDVNAFNGLPMRGVDGGLPTRTGYTFEGYYATPDASGTRYYNSAGKSWNNWDKTSSTATLYANWTPNTYTVKYNGNGNTGGSTASSSHTYGTAKGLTSNGFTKTGYTFQGWDTSSAGTTVVYTNGKSVSNLTSTDRGTVNLYAVWKANTYTVKYDANNGSGSMSSVTHTYDTAKALTTNAFTRTGYTFNGWNTKADGSGTSYADKASVKNLTSTNGGTVTLYAKWTPNTYTVQYNANAGSGSMSDQVFTYDVAQNLTANTFTRTGFTFAGWSLNSVKYTDGQSVKNLATSGSVTLYATWTPITYTVTYNLNSGTQGSNATTSYDITTATFSLPTPTRTGYTFGGWYTASNFSGSAVTQVAKGSTGDKTFYAKWTANSYTVTYDGNGGTPNAASKSVTYDSTYGTLANASRTGYTFAGWYTAASGGTKIETTTKVTITSAQTLYAHWTANTYTVMFNANAGTGTMSDQTFTYDVAQNLTANTFTRTGFTFAGWSLNSVKYTDGQSVKNLATSGSVTLYATWTPNTYTVKYNANGGSGTMNNSSHTYGTASNLSANTFTKTGYTFQGWDTSSNGTTVVHTDNKSVSTLTSTNGGTVNLYAVWEANTYTVTLSEGGTVTVTYDAAMPKLDSVPKKAGKVFAGYFDGENGTGTQYYTETGASARNWDKTGNVTLYAKWTNATVTLTDPGAKSIKAGNTLSFTLSATTDSGMGVTYSVTGLPDDAEATLNASTGAFSWETTTSHIGDHPVTFTATDGGVSVSKTITITVTSPVTTVTLNEGGTVTATYGEDMPTINSPKKAGKVFEGYYSEENGDGLKYYNDDGSSANAWNRVDSEVTIYANWIDATVTINDISNQSVTALGTLTFTAEATTDSGMGVTYSASNLPTGASLSADGAFSWTPALNQVGTYTFTITATDSDISASVIVNVTVSAPVSDVVFTAVSDKEIVAQNNVAFTVSATSSLGQNVTYSSTNLPAGATLDAATGMFSWTPELSQIGEHTVTFNAVDGYGSATMSVKITVTAPVSAITLNEGGNVTATYGEAMPAIEAPTKVGFIFAGYFDGENGTGTQYYTASGESAKNWDKTGAVTLYAYWTQGEIIITPIEDKTVAVEEELTFTVEASSTAAGNITYTAENLPAGATFNEATGEFSWTPTTKQVGEYTIIFRGSDGLNYAEVTVKVVVDEIISAVTFDEGNDSFYIVYGKKLPQVTTLTKEGLVFDGYYDGENGTGKKYYNADGSPAVDAWDKKDANVTLYANWVEGEDLFGIRLAAIRDMLHEDLPENKRFSVYLFAGIDSLAYKAVGFELTAKGVTVNSEPITNVYQKIKDNTNEYTASAFGSKCAYIIAQEIFFAKSFKDEALTFRPYAIKHDGEYIYGRKTTLDDIYSYLIYEDEDGDDPVVDGDFTVDGDVEIDNL